MMSRLDTQYRKHGIEVEVTSKPNAEYVNDDYFSLDLPVAPAIMVADEIIIEGEDVDDYTVETAVCRHLGLPEPEKKKDGKGILGRLLGR